MKFWYSAIVGAAVHGIPDYLKSDCPADESRALSFVRHLLHLYRSCNRTTINHLRRAFSFSCFLPRKSHRQRLWLFLGRGRRIRTRDPRFWRPVLYQLSYTPMLILSTHHIISHFSSDCKPFLKKSFCLRKNLWLVAFSRCGWFAVSAFWGALHGCFRLVSLDRRRRAWLQRKRGEPVGAVTEGSVAQSAVGARSRGFSVILSQNPFRGFAGLRAMNLWR